MININNQIKSKILRKCYDFHQKNPTDLFNFKELTELGMSNEEITKNVNYLHEKGLLHLERLNVGITFPELGKITTSGIDVIESPEINKSQFPFIQHNIQIIKGDIIDSVIAQSSGDQIINISESFNQIYNRIDTQEDLDSSTSNGLKKDIKELEEHLSKGKIDLEWILEWIKEKSSKIKEKTSWATPIIQSVIIEGIKKYLFQ